MYLSRERDDWDEYDAARVVVVLVKAPEDHTEHLEDVEWIQHLQQACVIYDIGEHWSGRGSHQCVTVKQFSSVALCR